VWRQNWHVRFFLSHGGGTLEGRDPPREDGGCTFSRHHVSLTFCFQFDLDHQPSWVWTIFVTTDCVSRL
jgi:hypothetical protein